MHRVDGKAAWKVYCGQVHENRSTGDTHIPSDIVILQLAAAGRAMAFNLLNLLSHVNVKQRLEIIAV